MSLRLDEEDLTKLKELAGRGESLSAYMRTVLKQHIKNCNKEKKSLLGRFRSK